MATISSLTITFTDSGPEYSPSDWDTGSIYNDATIKCVDNSDDEIEYATFYLYKADGSDVIADGEVPAGTTKTLAQIFPNETLVGNALGDGRSLRLAKIVSRTTSVGKPSNVKLDKTLARAENDPVELSWSAGSAGTNNSVTGYDVQQRDSTDGSTWGSWTTVSGSPVSGRSITVYPPDTVGHYRQFRVRTRGSAGSSYYSSYVTSGNTLRRKWDAFGAWADAQIIPRETYIRAEQIAQIRERIDEIRTFYGLEAYAYTPLVARETKIAKWAALIQELRDAINEIGTVQGWNTLEAGKPRIAHITQLRQIIDEM